jgi:hypothetical protein
LCPCLFSWAGSSRKCEKLLIAFKAYWAIFRAFLLESASGNVWVKPFLFFHDFTAEKTRMSVHNLCGQGLVAGAGELPPDFEGILKAENLPYTFPSLLPEIRSSQRDFREGTGGNGKNDWGVLAI